MIYYKLEISDPLVITKSHDAPYNIPALLEERGADGKDKARTVQTYKGFSFAGKPSAGAGWQRLCYQEFDGPSYYQEIDRDKGELGEPIVYDNCPWEWGHPSIINETVGVEHPRFKWRDSH